MEQAGVVVSDEFVPVIDLSTRHDPRGRAALATAIGKACESSGFFTIVGHGVPRELVERMFQTSREFFKLTKAEQAGSENRAGVSGLRRMGLYDAFGAHATGDLSEAERTKLGDYPSTWKVANIWPEEPAEFMATWHEYMAAMARLSTDIMRLFALALELPEAFFDDKFRNHVSLLLANYYHPQIETPPPGRIRREAHTDWGTLTVLWQQDDLHGLQVLRGDDDWWDVPPVPDGFVVNLGDLMAFWSGEQWTSTVHRVVNPDRGDTSSRMSIPFFHLPDHDASIEPVRPRAVPDGEQGPGRVTVGQWFTDKMTSTYAPTLPED